MKRIYYIVGKIIEKTQTIEQDLSEVVKLSEVIGEYNRAYKNFTKKDLKTAIDSADYLKTKMETMTMGQVIYIVQQTRCFTRQEIDELKFLLERRNYFVHEYFKYTPFKQIATDEKLLEDEFNATKDFFNRLAEFSAKTITYKKVLEQKYNLIKTID